MKIKNINKMLLIVVIGKLLMLNIWRKINFFIFYVNIILKKSLFSKLDRIVYFDIEFLGVEI